MEIGRHTVCLAEAYLPAKAGRPDFVGRQVSSPLMKLSDTGVDVGYVVWKIAGGKCFAGGVLPGSGEGVICADEFEADAGGEVGKGVAV